MIYKFKIKSPFTKNVLNLFYGLSLKNLITFLALPILTRLYTSEDFGNFQLLLSIIMIFSVVISLKYEMAIVLPKYKKESDYLILISLITLCFTTLILGLLFLFAGDSILKILNAPVLSPYVLFIIIGIFFTGLMLTSRFILVREKQFKELSKNNVYQSGITQAAAISIGIIKSNFLGLFVSYIAGNLLASLLILRKLKLNLKSIRLKDLYLFAYKYRKFPLINTISVFINNFSIELPVFMLSKFFGADVIGFYALANRLITTPMNLIGTSVSKVYFQAASEAFHEGPKRLLKIYKNTLKRLILIGIFPVIGVMILANPLVKIFLGAEWVESGTYMQIIIIWLFFGFINAPISTTYSIINKQEISLVIRLVSLLVRFIAMYIFREDPIQMLWALTISASLYYIVFNYLIYYSIKKLHGNS